MCRTVCYQLKKVEIFLKKKKKLKNKEKKISN